MNNEFYKSTFSIISNLKYVRKEELITTPDEEYIMKAFHIKIKKKVSYYIWRKVVMDFSLTTGNDIYDSCDLLIDEVYKKYK